VPTATARPDTESSTLAKVGWRLIPFLGLLYFAAFIDRVNVGFAAAQMNRDLGFSAYVYGRGRASFSSAIHCARFPAI
jgi:ACS family tartrate transporter-like MFS transporter